MISKSIPRFISSINSYEANYFEPWTNRIDVKERLLHALKIEPVVLINGPSGAGKSTLLKHMLEKESFSNFQWIDLERQRTISALNLFSNNTNVKNSILNYVVEHIKLKTWNFGEILLRKKDSDQDLIRKKLHRKAEKMLEKHARKAKIIRTPFLTIIDNAEIEDQNRDYFKGLANVILNRNFFYDNLRFAIISNEFSALENLKMNFPKIKSININYASYEDVEKTMKSLKMSQEIINMFYNNFKGDIDPYRYFLNEIMAFKLDHYKACYNTIEHFNEYDLKYFLNVVLPSFSKDEISKVNDIVSLLLREGEIAIKYMTDERYFEIFQKLISQKLLIFDSMKITWSNPRYSLSFRHLAKF